MKQAMWGIGVLAIIVLGLVALITIHGRDIRESEMEKSLSLAVDEAVEQLAMQGKYSIGDEKELVADFVSLLVEQLNVSGTKEQTLEDGTHIEKADTDENFKLTVDVAGVDAKKGFLSVHITEEFTHPNGKIGTYETDATLVLEKEEEKPVYQVTYTIPENIRIEAINEDTPVPATYKRYIQEYGEFLRTPSNPPDIGSKSFKAWVDDDGTTYTPSQLKVLKVEKQMNFTAIYG